MIFNRPVEAPERSTPFSFVTVKEGLIEVVPEAEPVASPETVKVIDWLAVRKPAPFVS